MFIAKLKKKFFKQIVVRFYSLFSEMIFNNFYFTNFRSNFKLIESQISKNDQHLFCAIRQTFQQFNLNFSNFLTLSTILKFPRNSFQFQSGLF